MKVYALAWRWHDGSAFGVALVFAEKEAGERQLEMMKQFSDREWALIEVDYIQEMR